MKNINISGMLITKRKEKGITQDELAADFTVNPFDEVVVKCKDLVKTYYSCFPLLLQIAVLFVNYSVTAPSPLQKEELLQEAITLCRHIRDNSNMPLLIKDAAAIESVCYLFSAQPRSESVIKESMIQNIIDNPVFAALKDMPRYQSILARLKSLVEN